MLTIGLGPVSPGGGGGEAGANLPLIAVFGKENGQTVSGQIQLNFTDSLEKMFYNCTYLTKIEVFDTSKITNFKSFLSRSGITSLPAFDFSEAIDVSSLADSCSNLVDAANMYFPKATSLQYIFDLAGKLKSANVDCPANKNMFGSFWRCTSLTSVTVKNSNLVETFYLCFNGCTALKTIVESLHVESAEDIESAFANCLALEVCKLHGLKTSVSFENSNLLSKDSVLYTIENAQTVTTTQTITLHADTFAQLTEDEIAIATEKGFSVVSA